MLLGKAVAKPIGVLPASMLIVGLEIKSLLPVLILFSYLPSQSQSEPRTDRNSILPIPKKSFASSAAMKVGCYCGIISCPKDVPV
jgi:hypothetical protein